MSEEKGGKKKEDFFDTLTSLSIPVDYYQKGKAGTVNQIGKRNWRAKGAKENKRSEKGAKGERLIISQKEQRYSGWVLKTPQVLKAPPFHFSLVELNH